MIPFSSFFALPWFFSPVSPYRAMATTIQSLDSISFVSTDFYMLFPQETRVVDRKILAIARLGEAISERVGRYGSLRFPYISFLSQPFSFCT